MKTTVNLPYACNALDYEVPERSSKATNKLARLPDDRENILSVATLFDVLAHELEKQSPDAHKALAGLSEACMAASNTKHEALERLVAHAESPVGQMREKLSSRMHAALANEQPSSATNTQALMQVIHDAASILVDFAELQLVQRKQSSAKRL